MEMFATGENETRIEAAWAVANLTSGGTPEQTRYLIIKFNTIQTLCGSLILVDNEENEIFEPALKSIESILKLGEQNEDSNPYAFAIKECSGLDKIECLKSHQNGIISQKATLIVETYFALGNSFPQVFFFL